MILVLKIISSIPHSHALMHQCKKFSAIFYNILRLFVILPSFLFTHGIFANGRADGGAFVPTQEKKKKDLRF